MRGPTHNVWLKELCLWPRGTGMIPKTLEVLHLCGYEMYIFAVCIDTLDSDHCVNAVEKKILCCGKRKQSKDKTQIHINKQYNYKQPFIGKVSHAQP